MFVCRKGDVLPFAKTQTDPESITLSGINQGEKDKNRMISPCEGRITESSKLADTDNRMVGEGKGGKGGQVHTDTKENGAHSSTHRC